MPLTLKQIIEESQQIVILDTSSYPTKTIDPKNLGQHSVKPAQEFSEIVSFPNLFAPPSVINNLQNFKDIIKDKLKFLEDLRKRQNEYAGSLVREACEFGTATLSYIERGIKELTRKLKAFNPTDSIPYQNFKNVLTLLDQLDENQTNETYKEIAATALFLSIFSKGAIIISDTPTLYNPTLRWYSILTSPALEGNHQLVKSSHENPITVYLRWKSEGKYISMMDSREITPLENLDFLNKKDRNCKLYIGHCLEYLVKESTHIKKMLVPIPA